MTTDTVQLLTRYNAHVNEQMNQILAGLSAEDWTRERGGYYPSFASLAAHIYSADVGWLARFNGLRPFAALKGEPFDFPPAPGQAPFESFEEYRRLRQRVDQAWLQFSVELRDDDLAVEYSYRNWRGEEVAKSFGGLVLHVLNHQTHHRGMIALLLDQMGIKNDFSNLVAVL